MPLPRYRKESNEKHPDNNPVDNETTNLHLAINDRNGVKDLERSDVIGYIVDFAFAILMTVSMSTKRKVSTYFRHGRRLLATIDDEEDEYCCLDCLVAVIRGRIDEGRLWCQLKCTKRENLLRYQPVIEA